MAGMKRRWRKRQARTSRLAGIMGWALAAVGLVAYSVNELTADIPAVHYGLYAVMFLGAWIALRDLQ